jgi:hypothetical protein
MKIKYKGKSGKREVLKCNHCEELFETLSIKVRAGGEKFCSKMCYNTHRRENSNKEYNHIKHQRKYKYGLNEDDFLNMLEYCNNSCEICEKKFTSDSRYTTACVDHNHSNGHVRGLLCHQCNKALGGFKDDVKLLNRAVVYLESKNKCHMTNKNRV